MQCPKCRSTKLRISVVFAGEVSCEFRNGGAFELLEDAALESFWDNSSVCECPVCRWTGQVRDAGSTAAADSAAFSKLFDDDTKAFLSETEISETQHELVAGRIPSPKARDLLYRLTAEVSHLRSLVSILERRVRAQNREEVSLSDAETVFDSSLTRHD